MTAEQYTSHEEHKAAARRAKGFMMKNIWTHDGNLTVQLKAFSMKNLDYYEYVELLRIRDLDVGRWQEISGAGGEFHVSWFSRALKHPDHRYCLERRRIPQNRAVPDSCANVPNTVVGRTRCHQGRFGSSIRGVWG